MLYTALTRSKKSVLILGEKNILEKAVLNKENRYSGLGTLIKKNFHNYNINYSAENIEIKI